MLSSGRCFWVVTQVAPIEKPLLATYGCHPLSLTCVHPWPSAPHALSHGCLHAAASVLARVSGNPYNIHLSQETPVRWVLLCRGGWPQGRGNLEALGVVLFHPIRCLLPPFVSHSAMFASQSSVSTVRFVSESCPGACRVVAGDPSLPAHPITVLFCACPPCTLQRDSMPVRSVVEVSPCAHLESYIEAKFLANGEGSAEDFESIRCVCCVCLFVRAYAGHLLRSKGGHALQGHTVTCWIACYTPSCLISTSASLVKTKTPTFSSGSATAVAPGEVFRLMCYRTSGVVDHSSNSHLRMYFLVRAWECCLLLLLLLLWWVTTVATLGSCRTPSRPSRPWLTLCARVPACVTAQA